jgi:hypothetical protein
VIDCTLFGGRRRRRRRLPRVGSSPPSGEGARHALDKVLRREGVCCTCLRTSLRVGAVVASIWGGLLSWYKLRLLTGHGLLGLAPLTTFVLRTYFFFFLRVFAAVC